MEGPALAQFCILPKTDDKELALTYQDYCLDILTTMEVA